MKIELSSFLLLISATVAFALNDTPAPALPHNPGPPCCREGLPPGKYSEKSLYTLKSTWTSDVGRHVKLEVLRGHPQVMALFFTNCEHSCPLIVADMKAIEKAVPRNLRGKVDFLLVSIDPDRDTPEVLHAYRAKHQLTTEHWTLLTGPAAAIKQLADMVGFQYYPGSQRQYAHSLLITILDQSGEIVFQQAGVGTSLDGAIGTLKKLAVSTTETSRSIVTNR
jgi:protein SCO1/2